MELIELITNMWLIVKSGWHVVLVLAMMAMAAGVIGTVWHRHA